MNRWDKFKAYWEDLGRPRLQSYCPVYFESDDRWVDCSQEPMFLSHLEYRIKDDPHWELRLKWVNSDKTLPIEWYFSSLHRWSPDPNIIMDPEDKWFLVNDPIWLSDTAYREGRKWGGNGDE